MGTGEYLVRDGREIVAVRVDRGLTLPLAHLMLPLERDGVLYWRHLRGGALVPDSSYVPNELNLPYDLTVPQDVRVTSYRPIRHGLVSTVEPITHAMDGEGKRLLAQQREMGIVQRLLKIERALGRAADNGDSLF